MAFTAQQKREQRAAKRQQEEEAAAARRPRQEGPSDTDKLNAAAMTRPDQVVAASGDKATPSSAGGKVIVACKVGVPYIDLQMQEEHTVSENTQTGPRDVKQYRRIGNVVRIRGTAYPRGTVPDGFPDRPELRDGAALTRGVDQEFMERWLEQNRLNPLVVNNMVFVAEHEVDIAAIAREHAGTMSGLEPLDPRPGSKDPRIPRPTNPSLSPIENARPANSTTGGA
jgi:hypothetical protein